MLPLIASEGERHWERHPVAVLMVSAIAVTLGIFTRLGTYTPWSPIMNAWSSDAVPVKYMHGNMPAYGNALSPSETKALVSFLMTLRGDGLQPAIDASRALTHTSQLDAPASPVAGNSNLKP